jgi:hypothetical protein
MVSGFSPVVPTRVGVNRMADRRGLGKGKLRLPNLDAAGQTEFSSEKCVRICWGVCPRPAEVLFATSPG